MKRRSRRPSPIAWLGLLAIWLAILAPVVSQTRAAMRAEARQQAVAAAVEMPHHEHAAHHPSSVAPAPSHEPGSHSHEASHGEDSLHACGYCELFAHSPFLFALAPLPPAAVPASPTPNPLPDAPALRSTSRLTAAPRGPPGMTAVA